MLPNITNTGSMCILLDLYGRFHTIGQAYKELQFGRLVHYTNHADYIGKSSEETNLPVYEGKFSSRLMADILATTMCHTQTGTRARHRQKAVGRGKKHRCNASFTFLYQQG